MRLSFAAVALALISGSAHSQECSTLLHQGIYDVRSSSSDRSSAASYANWFCDQKFRSAQDASNFGAALEFPFKGIPIKFGMDTSSQNWSQSYSKFCSSLKSDNSHLERVRDHVKTINKDILDAFNKCISGAGLHVWLERTEDSHTFLFSSKFKGETDQKATVRSFQLSENVQCREIPRQIGAAGFTSLCKRNGERPIAIVVNADWAPVGGNRLTLPGLPAPQRLDASAVRNNGSGLTWPRRRDDVQRTWTDSNEYCGNLSYAGVTGWQLPTLAELKDIEAYYRINKLQYWEGGVGNSFWSRESDTSKFSDGIAYFDFDARKSDSKQRSATENMRSWCVWRG